MSVFYLYVNLLDTRTITLVFIREKTSNAIFMGKVFTKSTLTFDVATCKGSLSLSKHVGSENKAG